MKVKILVMMDSHKQQVAVSAGDTDSWMVMAVLLEAVAVTAALHIRNGLTEHDGKPLIEYLQGYLKTSIDDYLSTPNTQSQH